jgi:hypothetical protein
MTTKLTLTIQESIAHAAADYAAESGKSLSELVESYLTNLPISKGRKKIKHSSVVGELRGSVPLPEGFDYKNEVANELMKKHINK